MVKKCTKCNKLKNSFEFYKNKRTKSGYKSECNTCNYEMVKKYLKTSKGKAVRKVTVRKYNKTEKRKAADRKYYQSEEGKAVNKKYRQTEEGKAAIARAGKKYKQSEKGKANTARIKATRRSKEKKVINDLTLNQWQDILMMQGNSCNICSTDFNEEVSPTRDHIVPVIRGGGLTKNNVQALCKFCNSKKGTKTMKELING